MTQGNGTKMMGQQMDRGLTARTKKPLMQHVTAIAEVFGDDRGLLKLLLTMSDDELAGVHKFAQAYMDGSFPIDVMIEPASQI